MKAGWEYKKIKEVCSFIGDGDWIESKDQSDSGIRLIQTGNIGTGIYRDKADKVKYISNATFSQLSCTEIFEGDCLLSRLPDPIGRSCLLPKLNVRTITAVDCTILRFKDDVLPTFFVYYTQSNSYYKDILSKTTGTTRKRISRKNLEKIGIAIPPKPTQLSIVSELDKLNELIQIKKEQLKDYDALAQSIFYEMFGDPVENEKGWEVKELIETVSPECKISYGIVQPGEHVEDGVSIVRPVDMVSTFISKDGLKKTTKEISNSYSRTILSGKELLVCVRGTTGVVSLVDESLQGANVTRGIAPLLFSENVERWFMYYQVKSSSVRGVISSLTRGIALKQINMSDLRKIRLILPPLSLQQSFAHKIEQIERQKAAVQSTITDLETLLAARMQYWFD